MHTGRIIAEHKTNFRILDEGVERIATVRGSFFEDGAFPKVGDWVQYEIVSEDQAVIEEILPRSSVIKRKTAHGEEEQVMVTNVNLMVVVMGLDGDYNLSRLERYLLLAKQSEVPAVVVLNKMDIADDVATTHTEVEAVAGDAPVIVVSAEQGTNMDTLLSHFTDNTTAVLLGSSGAGKSTITNWLLSEDKQATGTIREDDSRGRHTTTARELFTLTTGGALIDTPGIRELSLLDTSEEDEDAVFSKIEALAHECRFADCDHEKSAGCRVLEAIEEGLIIERELASYKKLKREREHEAIKRDVFKQRQSEKKRYQGYKKVMDQKRLEQDNDWN